MAADWIKMRMDLQSHPKVVRIMSATASDKFRVIGGLHAVWSVFDQHCLDGKLYGYTPDLLNQIIGWNGFAEAMVAVGWLEFDGDKTLSMPEFTEHNGQSAKRRAEDQKRKKLSRSCPQNVRTESDVAEDKERTREEKRRVNKNPCANPDGFTEFWSAYPKKKNKGDAEKAWNVIRPDDTLVSRILAAVEVATRSDGWRKEGGKYIPYPASWLRAKGWEDDDCLPSAAKVFDVNSWMREKLS